MFVACICVLCLLCVLMHRMWLVPKESKTLSGIGRMGNFLTRENNVIQDSWHEKSVGSFI